MARDFWLQGFQHTATSAASLVHGRLLWFSRIIRSREDISNDVANVQAHTATVQAAGAALKSQERSAVSVSGCPHLDTTDYVLRQEIVTADQLLSEQTPSASTGKLVILIKGTQDASDGQRRTNG
jgi:hypothetical protein